MNPTPHPSTPKTSGAVSVLKQAISIAVALLLMNDIFGGIIKYICASTSLIFLSYIPMLFSAAVVVGYFTLFGAAMRINKTIGIFLILFLLNAIYGLFIGRAAGAVGFGLYIWVPFFIGMLATHYRQEKFITQYTPLLWIITTAGVLLNSQIVFPWTGIDYQVFGRTLETSREWTSFGIDRIAGLSRASFVVSLQIALFCMLILAAPGGAIKKMAVWAISVLAIFLTTSKTTFIIMAIAPLMISFISYLAHKNTPDQVSKKVQRVAWIMLAVLACIMVALPVLTLTSRTQIDASGGVPLLFNSLFDRMYTVWPQAWDLIFKQDNPILMLLGRGVGGIGTPQVFFEALKINPGDNFFVYLYVSFGALSFIFIFYLLRAIQNWSANGIQQFMQYFAMALVVLITGLTANVVENSTSLLLLGLLIGTIGRPPLRTPHIAGH